MKFKSDRQRRAVMASLAGLGVGVGTALAMRSIGNIGRRALAAARSNPAILRSVRSAGANYLKERGSIGPKVFIDPGASGSFTLTAKALKDIRKVNSAYLRFGPKGVNKFSAREFFKTGMSSFAAKNKAARLAFLQRKPFVILAAPDKAAHSAILAHEFGHNVSSKYYGPINSFNSFTTGKIPGLQFLEEGRANIHGYKIYKSAGGSGKEYAKLASAQMATYLDGSTNKYAGGILAGYLTKRKVQNRK